MDEIETRTRSAGSSGRSGPRRYGQACTLAHALDLVGERWALLVVRELLLGPKRFTDLQAGMPGVSRNVISQRLRELQDCGVIAHQKLGPPTRAWVYELTEWGRELEPALVHLARWGSRSPLYDPALPVSVDAVALALRSRFSPSRDGALGATYLLDFGEDRVTVSVKNKELTLTRGQHRQPDVTVTGNAHTIGALIGHHHTRESLEAEGSLTVNGDQTLLDRLLATLTPALRPTGIQGPP